MLPTSVQHENRFSVLIVASEEVVSVLASAGEAGEWEAFTMGPGLPTADALDVALRQHPNGVVIDLSFSDAGLDMLATITREYPDLPVVVLADMDSGMLREAFLLGAFDFLVKPMTIDMSRDLALRLKGQITRANQGGVFSQWRTQSARHLLSGAPTSSGSLPHRFEGQSDFWVCVALDIVATRSAYGEVERALDQGLARSEAWGIREYDQAREVLQVTLLYHDQRPGRPERVAMRESQELVNRLCGGLFWTAAGVGPAVSHSDIAGSLQAARLALGYSLARGPGLHLFRVEQELAGVPCPDFARTTEQFLSRLQSGDDWTELVPPFLASLTACSLARRLHQGVQQVFSGIADTVPFSSEVERFYHIVDFVHGPGELRVEIEALCRLASQVFHANGRSLADRKLVEFQEYVAQHYGDWRLDLRLVCSVLQISPSYLGKILRRSLRTTFVDYVTEVRMARSRELLSSTDLLTSQIAEQVGYAYTHYFSGIFKKRFTVTPSEFRAWCRTKPLESVTA